MNTIMYFFLSFFWLIVLNTMISCSICVWNDKNSSPFYDRIMFHGVYVTYFFSLHSLLDGINVASVSWLLQIVVQWMWGYKCLFDILTSLSLDIHIQVEILGPMVVLVFWVYVSFELWIISDTDKSRKYNESWCQYH